MTDTKHEWLAALEDVYWVSTRVLETLRYVLMMFRMNVLLTLHALERGVSEYNPLFGHFENCSYNLLLIGQGSTHIEEMISEVW